MSAQPSVWENLFQEELYQVPSRVVIVLSKDWESQTEADKALLAKILGSVKLSLSVVQIVVKDVFTIADLAPFAPRQVIVFGAQLSAAPRFYEYLTLQGIPLIVADSLDKLDDAKKKSLWLALKQMFGL